MKNTLKNNYNRILKQKHIPKPLRSRVVTCEAEDNRFFIHFQTVWHCVCNCVLSNLKNFFLLKLSAVCTIWIVLMC
jgi:hypothetical protein